MHDVNSCVAFELALQRSHQSLIDLDRHHVAANVDQPGCECPKPRSDFDDVIARADLGQPNNAVDLIGVDQKVLAEGLVWMKAELGQQLGCGFSSVAVAGF